MEARPDNLRRMESTRSGPLPETLLGVWAHPDDEAYLSAGLMAALRAEGRRVVVATATRGESGTDDPTIWPPHRLARLRERELAASLAAVGVEEHHWLGHADGTLADVDPRVGAGQVADLLRRVRPDVVVTFGPDGMTGHPDHRAVSQWVTLARRSMRHAPRLWHATLTPQFHQTWGGLNESVGVWLDPAAPPSTPESDLVWRLPADDELRTKKYAALRAHASQTDALVARVGVAAYRAWWSGEYFVAA